MILPNGEYKTKNGSTVTVSGKYSGIYNISFDWVEEGRCIDCEVSSYSLDGYLHWYCEYCGDGSIELFPANS